LGNQSTLRQPPRPSCNDSSRAYSSVPPMRLGSLPISDTTVSIRSFGVFAERSRSCYIGTSSFSHMAPTTGTYTPVNPFRRLGVYSILLLLFVAYSRIFDFVMGSYHIPAICFVLVIASCVLCGA